MRGGNDLGDIMSEGDNCLVNPTTLSFISEGPHGNLAR